MQSGLHGNLHWRLDWDVKPDDNRWEHPVMFWAARYLRVLALSNHSADYMQGTRMNFLTKEDAIAFAEKQGRPSHTAFGLSLGWEYYIQEPHHRQFKPKAYATNFNYCTLPQCHANADTYKQLPPN
jgi:NADH dehydrogenase (ubiquinone) Fe-S protein 4